MAYPDLSHIPIPDDEDPPIPLASSSSSVGNMQATPPLENQAPHPASSGSLETVKIVPPTLETIAAVSSSSQEAVVLVVPSPPSLEIVHVAAPPPSLEIAATPSETVATATAVPSPPSLEKAVVPAPPLETAAVTVNAGTDSGNRTSPNPTLATSSDSSSTQPLTASEPQPVISKAVDTQGKRASSDGKDSHKLRRSEIKRPRLQYNFDYDSDNSDKDLPASVKSEIVEPKLSSVSGATALQESC